MIHGCSCLVHKDSAKQHVNYNIQMVLLLFISIKWIPRILFTSQK